MKTLFGIVICTLCFTTGVLYSTETKDLLGDHYVQAMSWVSGEAQKQEENAKKFAEEASLRAEHMTNAAYSK